jgi:hypothetical protein
MTDAVQAAVAADQLSLLMAATQQQQNSLLGAGIAANGVSPCSAGPLVLNTTGASTAAPGLPLAGTLLGSSQGTTLPLSVTSQGGVDQVQMLLSRPAEFNR